MGSEKLNQTDCLIAVSCSGRVTGSVGVGAGKATENTLAEWGCRPEGERYRPRAHYGGSEIHLREMAWQGGRHSNGSSRPPLCPFDHDEGRGA